MTLLDQHHVYLFVLTLHCIVFSSSFSFEVCPQLICRSVVQAWRAISDCKTCAMSYLHKISSGISVSMTLARHLLPFRPCLVCWTVEQYFGGPKSRREEPTYPGTVLQMVLPLKSPRTSTKPLRHKPGSRSN